MEVILLERIEKLGFIGDVVKVKNGYARNFLLPQKKALRASKENREYFETQKVQLEANNLKARQDAEKIQDKVDGMTVVMIRKAGDSGQLYGSVTTRDIAAAMTEAGVSLRSDQVILHHSIKMLGLHRAKIMLHPEVSVWAVVNVAKSAEEAEAQIEAEKALIEQSAKKAEDPYQYDVPEAMLESAEEDAAEESEAGE
ncbi:MAG: 50S ribosomal protein L9 [Pseudomonadota bacterium]